MAEQATKEEPLYSWVARVLAGDEIPELGAEQNMAQDFGDGFIDFIVSTVTFLGVASAITGVAIEPTVRKTQYAANRASPNAIPPLSDLVRFLVREALDPKYREEQMAGFNQEAFFDYARAQGLDREFAEAYWRAHWELPSPTQVAELVHRLRPGRVPQELSFTLEDAQRLFMQADMMPRYVNQLLAITYAPMTRVDIRRAFQLGAIPYEEMLERYKDIGYDEATAKILSDFTKKDLDPDERDITLGSLTTAYREGLVTKEELTATSKELGYTDRAVELYVRTQVAIKERQDKQKADARERTLLRIALATRRQSRVGKLNELDLRMQLEELDLSPPDVDAFIVKHIQPRAPIMKDLTVSQVLSAFKKGVYTRADTEEALGFLGYDQRETATLIATALADPKKPVAVAKGRDLTLAQVRQALKAGTIQPAEAASKVRAMGYDEEEVAILLSGYS